MPQPEAGFRQDIVEPQDATAAIDLASLVARFGVNAHVLSCGRQTPRSELLTHGAATCTRPDMEYFPFGKVQKTDKMNFEQQMVARLGAIRERYSSWNEGQGPKIILVVFAWAAEFSAITRLFPKVAQHFSRWIDVARLIGGPVSSLRDTMVWLKFHPRYLQGKKRHSPGMDAVRTLGVIVHLLSTVADGADINSAGAAETILAPAKRRFSGRMPPRKTFPHMVCLEFHNIDNQTTTAACMMPESTNTPDKLWDFLKGHFTEPSAVGVVDVKVQGRKIGQAGYACFRDEETVERFMEWNGREICGKKLFLETQRARSLAKLAEDRKKGQAAAANSRAMASSMARSTTTPESMWDATEGLLWLD